MAEGLQRQIGSHIASSLGSEKEFEHFIPGSEEPSEDYQAAAGYQSHPCLRFDFGSNMANSETKHRDARNVFTAFPYLHSNPFFFCLDTHPFHARKSVSLKQQLFPLS